MFATFNFTVTWTTGDEINFINALAAKRPEAFRKYAALVRAGMRSYSPNVSVEAVLKAIDLIILQPPVPAVSGDASQEQ
jgi:hypothetical protein